MAGSWTVSPACILLIYGIPGSGKTMLSTALLEETSREFGVAAEREGGGGTEGEEREAGGGTEGEERDSRLTNDCIFYAVHFDEFYPPDLREQGDVGGGNQFLLKQTRQRVHSCVEHFISCNHLGGSTVHHPQTCRGEGAATSSDLTSVSSPSAQVLGPLSSAHVSEAPSLSDWDLFVRSLSRHSSESGTLDANGRIVRGDGRATVLLLDDNMPLRSMRYEYFQLARKYSLGYAEVCITCSLSVALERNSRRSIPIPHSTIETMEQKMELPDPAQHHWEERNVIVRSDCERETFVQIALANIRSLVKDALSHPVQTLPQVDTELKETCKLANINSYVHQADNILRKCITEAIKKPTDSVDVSSPTAKETKAGLARQANIIRKQLLVEIRTGYLCGKPLSVLTTNELTADSDEFKKIVGESFSTLLKE